MVFGTHGLSQIYEFVIWCNFKILDELNYHGVFINHKEINKLILDIKTKMFISITDLFESVYNAIVYLQKLKDEFIQI